MKLSEKAKKIITYVLAAAAAVVILTGINGLRLLPLPSVELESPAFTGFCDGGALIVDSNDSRILITDDNLRVRKAIGMNLSGSPFDIITDIAGSGDRIYVCGASKLLDGIYLDSESVAEYSSSGRFLRILYSESYGADDYLPAPSFFDLKITAEGRLHLLVGRDGRVEILDITDGTAVPVVSLQSDIRFNEGEMTSDGLSFSATEWVGRYYRAEDDGSFTRISDESFWSDFFASIDAGGVLNRLNLTEYDSNPSQYSLLRTEAGEPEMLLYTTREGLNLYDFASGENSFLTSLKVSPGLFICNLAFAVSAVFLAVFLTVKLISFIKRRGAESKARYILVLLLVSAGISAFFTLQSFTSVEEEYASRLEAQNRQLSAFLERYYSDLIEDACETGVSRYCSGDANRARICELKRDLTAFAVANGKTDCFYTGLQLFDGTGGYIAAYSDAPVDTGYYEYTAEDTETYIAPLSEYSIVETNDAGIDYIACVNVLRDGGGNVRGLVTVGFIEEHLKSVQLDRGLTLLMSLVVLEIIVFVSYKALKSLRADIEGYRTDRALDPHAPKLPLFCGIAAFLVTAICQFDSVILVYAVRKLCEGMSDLEAAKLASIPISLYSFGIMGGSALPSLTSRVLKERVSSAVFCLLGAFSMAAAVYAMNTSNIYIFCAAKLIEGAAIGGAAYSLIFASPFNCEDRDRQKALVRTAQASAVSAAVLGIFAGGYVSERLSYSAIFAVKGAMCILLALVCVPMFSGSKNVSPEKGRKRGGAWSFYLRPGAIALYLCCILPLNLMNGYRSYLFPIYSQSAGLSAVMLSNIYVIARASSLVTSGITDGLFRKIRPRRLMCLMLLSCAACFMLFLLSPNIWWAIAVLFISNVLLTTTNVAGIYRQSELSEEYGYDPKDVSLCSETVKGVFTSLSTPVSSLFLSLGNSWACAAIGAACFAVTGTYSLFGRKKQDTAE